MRAASGVGVDRILAIGPAVLLMVALAAGVTLRAQSGEPVAARPAAMAVLTRAAPVEGFSAALLDLELPCIPEAGQTVCSDPRLRLWSGDAEAWQQLAAALGGPPPADDDRFWQVIRFRWEAGDPAARAAYARANGWPHLRISEARFRPADSGEGEYVEISNLGGGDQEMTGWRVRPGAVAAGPSFLFAEGSILTAGDHCRAYVATVGEHACPGRWLDAGEDVLNDRAGELLLTVDFPALVADRNSYRADPAAQLPPPALRGVQTTP